MPALLLAVLFLGATGYVVVSSGARNAETSGIKAARIGDANAARARELKLLAQAEAMHRAATSKLDAACKGGDGKNCAGVKATLAVYEAAIRGHNGTLRELGPELPASGGYGHAAKVIAALPGVTATASDIEARLVLLLPFVTVLIAELGTIVFLHIGLGNHGGNRTVAQQRQGFAKGPATIATVANSNDPGPKGGTRQQLPTRSVATKAAASADVIRLIGRGEALPSQETLAARWGVHKGTASKWLAAFEADGIISRHTEGRCKRVAAA